MDTGTQQLKEVGVRVECMGCEGRRVALDEEEGVDEGMEESEYLGF